MSNATEIRYFKARAYADDVALFSRNLEHAQTDLDNFADACAAAGLAINHAKTEYIRMPDKRTIADGESM